MKVAIIGAGIGGLTTAIALQQLDIDVTVYESAQQIKPLGAGIGLATNAIKALEKLGIAQKVIAKGNKVVSLQVLDEEGRIIRDHNTTLLPAAERGENLVIHRADLHEVLLQQIDSKSLVLGKRCIHIVQKDREASIYFADQTRAEADLVIAADGIHSAIRQQLLPESRPRFAGYTCWRAVIDNPSVAINTMVSAETWSRYGRMGISPLPNNKIYWYACIKTTPQNQEMRRMTPTKLAARFANLPAHLAEVLSATASEQLIWNDIHDIKPLKHFAYGNILLLGDAAHATTPNMGQGACLAIEDALVLQQCLQKSPDLQQAMAIYQKRRIARTKKVMRLSRLLGWVAHWQQPVWCRIRNFSFRMMPDFFTKRQLAWLFDVDF